MDMLRQLNAAMEYIEANLRGRPDFREAARLACVAEGSFARFFSYMTGMTLKEYVRRRRMSLAAQDLRRGSRVIDVAVRYGYDSADAFSRAFAMQHGVAPSAYRKNGGSLKICPPASFYIQVRGAREMNFRMIELSEITVSGVSMQFDGQGYKTREELRHRMWADDCEDIPGRICGGRWDQSGSTACDGVWYGIWQDGRYMIARETGGQGCASLEGRSLPAGMYAAFQTGCGGLAWEEIPRLTELVLESWLPSSEYRRKGDLIIEVLHLWTDRETRRKNRYYEVWLPVERKAQESERTVG